jgi:beta-glucanase (GH16 family)
MREVEMSGFGNNEFEMTTASSNNSYVKDGRLYIMPTLTEDVIGQQAVFDGYTFNLTGCTYNLTHPAPTTTSLVPSPSASASGNATTGTNGTISTPNTLTPEMKAYLKACSATSNSSTGAIIHPIQSARLSTRNSASIKYGRVSIRAKLPKGDWIWPALWMLPKDGGVYGEWPRSGEIDIMEARGNGPRYGRQGINYVRGSLNWGPSPALNAVAKTYGAWHVRRASYDQDFHDYVLEWTEKFMRIYVDSRLHYMLDMRLGQPFFDRGDFPKVMFNGSAAVEVVDPWVNGTRGVAPFDQSFYLIMNVAVGGTNGWFPDGVGDKPWLDQSPTAMRDFALKKAEWFSTWPSKPEDRAMVVDSVKMWQKCK